MKKLNLSRTKKHVDKIAEHDFKNNKVFGSCYSVYQKNNFDLYRCYGTVGVSTTEKVTEKTVFRLASMTKPVTAVAVLLLAERGLLSLDDTIDRYIPGFSDIHIKDADGKDLGAPQKLPKIRNLLSHNSGLGSDIRKLEKMTAEDYESIDSTIEYLLRAGLDFEPESMQYYSPTAAFDVAVKIAETVTGRDFQDFLSEEIFTPLEMTDTTFIPTPEQRGRIIAMHCNKDGKNAEKEMPGDTVFENVPEKHYLGGGGLVSTLEDYGKFAKMLLDKGVSQTGKRILKEETLLKMTEPQIAINKNQSWGLGVRVITHKSYPHLPMGCFGWSGAYGTHFFIDPKNGISAVFMKNSAVDGGAGNKSAVKLERAVYSFFG